MYADSPYSLAEVLEVFRYYFEQYEAYTGAPHPPIRAVQIERIIREMPYIDETDKANSTMDIDPDCYEDMIDKHFRTRYRNCDYTLVTFVPFPTIKIITQTLQSNSILQLLVKM